MLDRVRLLWRGDSHFFASGSHRLAFLFERTRISLRVDSRCFPSGLALLCERTRIVLPTDLHCIVFRVGSHFFASDARIALRTDLHFFTSRSHCFPSGLTFLCQRHSHCFMTCFSRRDPRLLPHFHVPASDFISLLSSSLHLPLSFRHPFPFPTYARPSAILALPSPTYARPAPDFTFAPCSFPPPPTVL